MADNNILSTEQKVRNYIELGKWLLEEGNEEQAERAYKTAVAVAGREVGQDSGIAGCALTELWCFYDKLGREKEAHNTWLQLIAVIRARYVEILNPKFG